MIIVLVSYICGQEHSSFLTPFIHLLVVDNDCALDLFLRIIRQLPYERQLSVLEAFDYLSSLSWSNCQLLTRIGFLDYLVSLFQGCAEFHSSLCANLEENVSKVPWG